MTAEDDIGGASAPAPRRIDAPPARARRRPTSYRVTIRGRAMTAEDWSDLLGKCLDALSGAWNDSEG